MSMRYNKPQILTITKATAAIQGSKKHSAITDGQKTTTPGYEDNE
jgi:hypothetical protein